jgi:hypothetical protein
MDQRLIEKLRASKLSSEEELATLADQLKGVLGYGVHTVKRGFIGRGKFQSMTALVGDQSFKAEIIGARARFSTAPSLHGIGTMYTECSKDEWVTALTAELKQAGS